MSEALDPAASAQPEETFNELLDSIKPPPKPKTVRQGLPTEYRMRHDAHYVEELGAKSQPPHQDHSAASGTIPMSAALRDMCQEFEGLASCFNLLERGPRPLRERLGLALARIGVQRSIRYAQNLRILLEDQHPLHREVQFDELVRQAFVDFREELHLTESTLVVDMPASPLLLHGDAALLRTALRACAGASIGLIETSGRAANLDVSAFAAGDVLHCEIRQDACAIEAQHLAGLFDLESSARPGGRSGAVALSAAKRIAQLHGGQFEARRTGAGGSAFVLSLPKTAKAHLSPTAN